MWFDGDATMESLNILNNLRIASPCRASWATMKGDDRVRFCDACAKHVYNVSNLKADEASALIQESEGRLCVRLYRRNDGTVLTADCPVGLRVAIRRRLIRMAAAAVVLLAALRSGIWLFANSDVSIAAPPLPNGPSVTFSDWGDWALAVLGFKTPAIPPGPVTMGKICPVPQSTSNGPVDGAAAPPDAAQL